MSDQTPRPKFPFLQNGIAQVALIVKDLDRAMEAYWELCGIGPWHVYTYGKPLVKKMSYRGQPADYKMRIGLSWIGPLRLELIEMLEGETIYAEFVEKHGYGLHHFGVQVEDAPAAIAEAEAAGFAMIQDGSGYGADGDGHYAYLDTEDALGVIVELIEFPAGRVPPERIYPPDAEATTV